MVSVFDIGQNSMGLNRVRLYCVMFLSKILFFQCFFFQGYKWILVYLILGINFLLDW